MWDITPVFSKRMVFSTLNVSGFLFRSNWDRFGASRLRGPGNYSLKIWLFYLEATHGNFYLKAAHSNFYLEAAHGNFYLEAAHSNFYLEAAHSNFYLEAAHSNFYLEATKSKAKSKAKAKQQKTLYTSRFVRVILVGYPC